MQRERERENLVICFTQEKLIRFLSFSFWNWFCFSIIKIRCKTKTKISINSQWFFGVCVCDWRNQSKSDILLSIERDRKKTKFVSLKKKWKKLSPTSKKKTRIFSISFYPKEFSIYDDNILNYILERFYF